MADPIATIFHVTDMHLCVEPDGGTRKNKRLLSRMLVAGAEHAWPQGAREFLGKAMWHREPALERLGPALRQLSEQEASASPGAPIVVLQGGDVEALGSWAPDGLVEYEAFPSFDFVHKRLRPDDERTEWLDIFGNHDTWPGRHPVPPPSGLAQINRVRIGTVPGLVGPWPDCQVLGVGEQVPLVIARVNTVAREADGEAFAYGVPSEHPPNGEDLSYVLDQLEAELGPWQHQRAVRAVLLHHPIHYARELADRHGPNRLMGADELAACLRDLRVQLVIAGHVHALDPPASAVGLEAGCQEPLEYPTVQLVAETPTQDWPPRGNRGNTNADLPTRSFCRYRLLAQGETFDIERTVFRWNDNEGEFMPVGGSPRVFRGIRLG
ncbi:MAG TPA: metallophosphoesterase [Solirubrobacteraceae bacterium]|nr:metallophosphoesterase [Solirubrobacteraceae bacterium]